MPIIVKRRVNDLGDSAPSGAQIAVSPGGDVLATWYAPGRLARLLDEDGNLLSATIAFPTAASTAAWIDPDEFAILSGDNGVSIQRYNRIGETVGGPLSVAAGGRADDLALLASGNVVATYRVGNEIRGQILDSALAPAGADFLIYDLGTNGFGETIVTPLTGGGFALTAVVGSGGDESLERVAMFDASGSKTAGIAPGVIQRPDVAALPDGGFVLTTSDLATGQLRFYNADGTVRAESNWELLGQQGAFDPDVTLLGTEIVLVTYENRIKTGEYFHIAALYSVDGLFLTSGSVSFNGAATFDVAATGAASFVTIEHSSTGPNADTIVTYWEFDNIVFGTAGDDVLNALDRFEILVGREGNDLYFVDARSDPIVERANQGDADRVLTNDDYVMPEGLAVEILSTDQNFGTSPIDLTGNEFTQYIYGNTGHNVLRGRHAGGEVMTGFEGDDTYYVDHEDDQVREEQYAASNTQDRVIASVSWVLGAGQEVEFITANVPATAPIYLVANELGGQTVTGHAGNNTLDGGGGQNDVMIGGGGDDIYIVREALDHIQEAAGLGFDRVMALTSYTLPGAEIEILATIDPLATTAIDLTGNGFSQYLYGNAGVNRLNGGGGGDVLTGFEGD
ncbi:MAG TPA: calcium-binding protein, partial [Allosphingosinicella sp.]|nr:calcium-binding protein [Allosphingosinicella sp.]